MNTVNKIMESSYKLFLENGLNNVSIADISKESKLSPGTIYYYFKDKNEIILSVLDKYVLSNYYNNLKNSKKHDKNTKDKLKGFYIESLKFENFLGDDKFQNEDNFKKMLSLSFEGIQNYPLISKNYNEYNKIYTDYIEEIIEFGKKENEIRMDIATIELVNLIKSDINGIFFLWIVQNDFNSKDVIESNFKNIWDFIKK